MDAKSTLQRLHRLQDLAGGVRKSQHVVDGAPGRIEEIEARFRERNAEFVALQERYEALDQDHKNRSVELVDLEEQQKKYMADLMGVKNQREYAAMLREIDQVKGEIAGHEEAILRAMETLETLKGELANFAEHIKKERETVGTERGEVEAEAAEAQSFVEKLSDERAQIEAELPSQTVTTLKRLEASRQGIFLSKADNGTCMSCFVRVRPQMFQEIKMASVVHACSNCRRFLYYEPSLQPASLPASSGEASATTDDPNVKGANVEAVNGGAV